MYILPVKVYKTYNYTYGDRKNETASQVEGKIAAWARREFGQKGRMGPSGNRDFPSFPFYPETKLKTEGWANGKMGPPRIELGIFRVPSER